MRSGGKYIRFTKSIPMKPNQKETYHGFTSKKVKTEHFNISITNHPAESEIDLHCHMKPYLCLLASGKYEEKSFKSEDNINSGLALYRKAGYEHANRFSDQEGICLNIEIDKPAQFYSEHNFDLKYALIPRKASLDLYRILYGVRMDYSKDLLNIYCYESFDAHFEDSDSRSKLDWVYKVKEYIHAYKMEKISLEKLSEEFHLHPNYLVRKFKEVTGYKLSDYLSKLRIEYLMDNLINSNTRLTDIALSSGFYDQSHFNRVFKKQLSSSPMKFRKVVRG